MKKPRRLRLRATVWLIRRIIAGLDALSAWEVARLYPHAVNIPARNAGISRYDRQSYAGPTEYQETQ
jgi:hypothetical protein